jgi:hypothetical protein
MSLLNRKAVKGLALSVAEENKAHTFSRVSPEFLDRIEATLRNLVTDEIHKLPSVGKTIK